MDMETPLEGLGQVSTQFNVITDQEQPPARLAECFRWLHRGWYTVEIDKASASGY